MAKIVISKLQLSAEEPIVYSIGFTVTASNGRSFYIDTNISLISGMDDDVAVSAAYTALESEINSKLVELEAKSILLGTEYTPE